MFIPVIDTVLEMNPTEFEKYGLIPETRSFQMKNLVKM